MAKSENNIRAVFTDIAAAIRSKVGEVGPMTPRDFKDQILLIETGEEGTTQPYEMRTVLKTPFVVTSPEFTFEKNMWYRLKDGEITAIILSLSNIDLTELGSEIFIRFVEKRTNIYQVSIINSPENVIRSITINGTEIMLRDNSYTEMLYEATLSSLENLVLEFTMDHLSFGLTPTLSVLNTDATNVNLANILVFNNIDDDHLTDLNYVLDLLTGDIPPFLEESGWEESGYEESGLEESGIAESGI